MSVSNLYIPRIGPHIFLQQYGHTYRGNILIAHRLAMSNQRSFKIGSFRFAAGFPAVAGVPTVVDVLAVAGILLFMAFLL